MCYWGARGIFCSIQLNNLTLVINVLVIIHTVMTIFTRISYNGIGICTVVEYSVLVATCKRSIIGELRVDVLKGSLGFLSDNKASYHRQKGFTALLEITKQMLLERPKCLIIAKFCSMQLNHLTH